jgi:hypothetical protein
MTAGMTPGMTPGMTTNDAISELVKYVMSDQFIKADSVQQVIPNATANVKEMLAAISGLRNSLPGGGVTTLQQSSNSSTTSPTQVSNAAITVPSESASASTLPDTPVPVSAPAPKSGWSFLRWLFGAKE